MDRRAFVVRHAVAAGAGPDASHGTDSESTRTDTSAWHWHAARPTAQQAGHFAIGCSHFARELSPIPFPIYSPVQARTWRVLKGHGGIWGKAQVVHDSNHWDGQPHSPRASQIDTRDSEFKGDLGGHRREGRRPSGAVTIRCVTI